MIEDEHDLALLRAAGDGVKSFMRAHRGCSEDGEGRFKIQQRPLRMLCICGVVFRIEREA